MNSPDVVETRPLVVIPVDPTTGQTNGQAWCQQCGYRECDHIRRELTRLADRDRDSKGEQR